MAHRFDYVLELNDGSEVRVAQDLDLMVVGGSVWDSGIVLAKFVEHTMDTLLGLQPTGPGQEQEQEQEQGQEQEQEQEQAQEQGQQQQDQGDQQQDQGDQQEQEQEQEQGQQQQQQQAQQRQVVFVDLGSGTGIVAMTTATAAAAHPAVRSRSVKVAVLAADIPPVMGLLSDNVARWDSSSAGGSVTVEAVTLLWEEGKELDGDGALACALASASAVVVTAGGCVYEPPHFVALLDTLDAIARAAPPDASVQVLFGSELRGQGEMEFFRLANSPEVGMGIAYIEEADHHPDWHANDIVIVRGVPRRT